MSTVMPIPVPGEPVATLPPVSAAFPHIEIVVVDDATSVEQMARELASLWAGRSPGLLSLDCEATGKDPTTATPLLLQVAATPARAYVVNLTKVSPTMLAPLWEPIEHGWPVVVIGHNLAYDYKLLRSHGYVWVADGVMNYGMNETMPFTRVYDTMLAELVLTTGHHDQKALWLRSVSLKRLAEKYLAVELDKDTRMSFVDAIPDNWEPTDEQVEYAAYDVVTLFSIREQQLDRLKQEELLTSVKLRFDAVIPVVEMELRGMRIDQDAWRAYLADVERQRDAVEQRLIAALSPYEWAYRQQRFFAQQTALTTWQAEHDLVLEQVTLAYDSTRSVDVKEMGWGEYKKVNMKAWRELHPRPPKPSLSMDPINLGSPQQMLRALTALGLELVNTGKDERLRVMRGELTNEQRAVMDDYAEFSGLDKILSGFGENVLAMIDPQTGRLHSHFNIHVTETGRWSSQNPNFQNMPRQDAIRHAFVADPGLVVVTADYTGQELAIVAALSGDIRMKRDILAGKDLYCEVASRVWGVKPEQVSKAQRQKAKAALLGINYGLSAKGLEKKQGIAAKEAEGLLAAIKNKYPSVVAYGDRMATQAFEQKYVATAAGTRRYFTRADLPRWQFDTMGRNAPVQGTAADIAYRLIARMQQNLVPLGILPVNFVHDEVVALAPEGMENAGELVSREMQAAFEDILPERAYGLRIRVDVHVAKYWTKE